MELLRHLGGRKPRLTSVLIVEDDVECRRSLAELLGAHGFKVSEAGHGADALARLKAGLKPSVILTDINMPLLDGWDFCRKLQDDPALSKIPVIMMTGVEGVEGKSHALARLSKPVDLDRLLKILRSLR